MSEISKELKKAKFKWDGKFLVIGDENGNEVKLNKIYSFSLARFILRVCQNNFLKQFSKKEIKEADLESEVIEEYEDPNQLTFGFEEQQQT